MFGNIIGTSKQLDSVSPNLCKKEENNRKICQSEILLSQILQVINLFFYSQDINPCKNGTYNGYVLQTLSYNSTYMFPYNTHIHYLSTFSELSSRE